MFLLAPLLLTAPILPQTVGGDWPTITQLDGQYLGGTFGSSVDGAGDVNGDGFHDIIVGAPYEDYGGLSIAGSVYVHSGSDGSILHEWHASTDFRWMGLGVGGAGDVNADGYGDLIFGDPYLNNGEAYVYSGVDGTLLHNLSGALLGDVFGYDVAGAGDVNADGYSDVIVGAPSADPGGISSAGSAYVYSGFDGSLLHQWNGTGASDQFGRFVQAAGDINADGHDDLLVGGSGTDVGALVNAGSLYAYSGIDGSLLHRWDGAAAEDRIGSSGAGVGDWDSDGYGDVLVGGPGVDPPSGTDRGRAWVYSGLTGAVIHQWDGPSITTSFGTAVTGTGDMNGDGIDDLAVTANNLISYYSGADGSLIHEWFGPGTFDGFGSCVADSVDFNADGSADVVVGSPRTDSGVIWDAGAIFVLGAFNPILSSDAQSISVANGANINLSIDFPVESAGYPYVTLMSLTGTGPTWYGIDIPLDVDGYLIGSISGSYPFPFSVDLHGALDLNGDATASFTIPAGLVPTSMIGRSFWHAAVTLPGGPYPEMSSVAVEFTFAP